MEMIGSGPGYLGLCKFVARTCAGLTGYRHMPISGINQFDYELTRENCITSPDVISFAREKGYFNGVAKDFTFAEAYAPLDFGARRFCEARIGAISINLLITAMTIFLLILKERRTLRCLFS